MRRLDCGRYERGLNDRQHGHRVHCDEVRIEWPSADAAELGRMLLLLLVMVPRRKLVPMRFVAVEPVHQTRRKKECTQGESVRKTGGTGPDGKRARSDALDQFALDEVHLAFDRLEDLGRLLVPLLFGSVDRLVQGVELLGEVGESEAVEVRSSG